MSEYEARGHYRNTSIAESYDAQFRQVRRLADIRTQALSYLEERAFRALFARVQPQGTVLDIACGTGRYVRRALGSGCRVVGVDISMEMLTIARRSSLANPNLISLQQADAAHLPFADRQFDGVICLRLYHRVPPELRCQMIQEAKRVGRRWAILFFGMTNPWLRIRQFVRSAFGGRPSNPYPVTMRRLRHDLSEAGLRVRASRWILPGLADGLIVLVEW
jgi:ubiquinone/menaquinone biosynthesis C-methylase UbiE